MSIFGFFKKKADIKPQVEKETAIEAPVQRGVAISKRVELDSHNENSIRNCYIAFDVETTGLRVLYPIELLRLALQFFKTEPYKGYFHLS